MTDEERRGRAAEDRFDRLHDEGRLYYQQRLDAERKIEDEGIDTEEKLAAQILVEAGRRRFITNKERAQEIAQLIRAYYRKAVRAQLEELEDQTEPYSPSWLEACGAMGSLFGEYGI